MRFWYDTEFLEDGRAIELVSIGVVAEDGREYYAVSTDFDPSRAVPWVQENVLPQLPPHGDPAWKPRAQIRAELVEFLGDDPQLWAWIGPYDHIVLVQLWGDMTALPRHLPRWTREVKQLWWHLGRPALPKQPDGEHHALADARHVKVKWEAMAERAYLLGLQT